MNRDILSKIEQEQMISREELEELLMTTDQELIEELYRRARAWLLRPLSIGSTA